MSYLYGLDGLLDGLARSGRLRKLVDKIPPGTELDIYPSTWIPNWKWSSMQRFKNNLGDYSAPDATLIVCRSWSPTGKLKAKNGGIFMKTARVGRPKTSMKAQVIHRHPVDFVLTVSKSIIYNFWRNGDIQNLVKRSCPAKWITTGVLVKWESWFPKWLQLVTQVDSTDIMDRAANAGLQKIIDLFAEGSIVEHETAHIVFLLVFDQ